MSSTNQFQVKGWPAVAVLAAVAVFFGFRLLLIHGTLGPEQLDSVRMWLLAEYAGPKADALREAMAAGDEAATERLAEELLATQDIRFVSVKARGSDTDEVVVRLEVEVDGHDPPDGERVRYFVLEHSMTLGWRVVRETWAPAYYLKLF